MNFKLKLLSSPIQRCTAFLLVFAAFAFGFNASGQLALHLVTTLGFGLALYIFYETAFPSKHKNIWDTAITGLILFLILHYGTGFADLFYPLLATFFAITLKFFLEIKGFPVGNPAAAALLLTALVSAFIPGMDRPFVSWWGASFQGLVSLGLLAIWIVGGFYQWKKWPIVLSFLATFAVGILLRGEGLQALKFSFTDSMIYFFATIMLVDPKTSPFRPREQIAYGVFCALVLTALYHWNAPYPELFALLAANLAFFGRRLMPRKTVAPQVPTSPLSH